MVAAGLLGLTLVAALPALAGPLSRPRHDMAAGVRWMGGDHSGFTVEIDLPRPSLAVESKPGGPCGRLRLTPIEGGQPQDEGETAYAWLVGVPDRTDTTVRVEEVSEELWQPEWPLCPGAEPTTLDVRPLETGDPGAPVVRLEDLGRLRGQPIARLVVQPLARTPDGRFLWRSRLRLRIDFPDAATVAQVPPLAGPFAAAGRALLNGEALPRRQQGGAGGATGIIEPVGSRDATRNDPAGTGGLAAAALAWDAPGDGRALKVVVNRDGPVVLTGADLAQAGWNLAAIDPAALTLEQPAGQVGLALSGLENGRLVAASRLEFQGRAMTGPYTRENVYWLRAGQGQAVHFGRRLARPGTEPPAVGFLDRRRYEEDTRWFASMDPRHGDDRWMWDDPIDAHKPDQRSITVTLALRDPLAAAAELRVRLQGYTDDPRVDPDHHLRLFLNGQVLGATRFDGLGVHETALSVPAGLLVAGDNALRLQAVGDTGAVVDAVYLNYVDLAYQSGYRAGDNRLDFAAPGPGRHEFTLGGFRSPQVTVLDVTDPRHPVVLEGLTVSAAGDGSYEVRLADLSAADTRYLAYTPEVAARPLRIEANAPSELRGGAHGADYIVISHPDFLPALDPLVDRRAAQGLRTAVVRIDDIYDEFSGGLFNPEAIRDFLRHAYRHWAPPAPTYVLLVGESNMDYRRGYGAGPINYVPTITLDMLRAGAELTAYVSDQWFVTLDEDDLVPDMLVGRFSVATVKQAETAVAKTLTYEDQAIDAPWRRRAVMVTDDTDAAIFEGLSEALIQTMPRDTEARRLYAGRFPVTGTIASAIGTALEEGALVFNFVGHGNVNLWSPGPGGYIFDNNGIAKLRNGAAMPVFIAATCLNGFISHPLKPVSMTELWLTHPEGGGALAWSPSGFGSVGEDWVMLAPVFAGLYDGRHLPFSALVLEASTRALARGPAYADIVRMFVLIGDPALVASGVPALPTPSPTPSPGPAPAGLYLPLTWR